MKIIYLVSMMLIILILTGCTEKGEPGTASNPIKMYFVPSMEAGKVVTSGNAIAEGLEKLTGYKFKIAVPTNYAAVIEAMGTNQADIGWLPTFAYILANQKYQAHVALTTVRNGLEKYRGQLVVRADSGIESLQDINGKIVAYTDASSTSGYIYPSALLKMNGIKADKYYFAGGHPQAILAVYQGSADVGCSYWSPPHNNEPQDARKAVLETYPDIMEKVIPIAFTDWIPNDTVTFRNGFSEEMKASIVDALLKFAASPEGHDVLFELYSVDNFVKSSDSDYDIVRQSLETLGFGAEEFIK
ncbi:MAG: phosphate/phosphite/phosphonate ABC transporter substrate-binding protein [Candidatus Cloacimonetes bacterium]|nr:phosphate/phosphite/phosphonate ABC transporter substrate-binding protein [Candidatus Cloacimonadota bacterium]